MALRRDAKVELLRRVPLFAACSTRELRQLAAVADELDLREGTVLMREGRRGREFFTLIEGTVRVSKGGRKLADIGPGDFVGEVALLTHSPRMATATALTPVRTLVIADRDFRIVINNMPSIALKVLNTVAERMARTAQS